MCIFEESDSFHSPAVTMCGHILFLLLTVQLVCSATEYYVRPTEPNGTAWTCPPDYPCLTLNEYTNDTDHYIKSNTVFTFLPGKHHMDRPLQIGHVQNITLKSAEIGHGQTVLVPQYHCESDELCPFIDNVPCDFNPTPFKIGYCTQCYAIQLSNVSHAHVDGIQVALRPQHSGLLTWYCKNILISHAVLTSISNETFNPYEIGLGIYKSSKIVVDSLQANNVPWGIFTNKSGCVTVNNTNIQNCSEAGVLIFGSDNVSVVNTLLQKSKHGILSVQTRFILINNCTLLENRKNGIKLMDSNNIDILDSLSDSNGCAGIEFNRCNGSTLMNILVKHSRHDGIVLELSIDTNITNSSTIGNNGSGINLESAMDTYIVQVFSKHNGKYGLTATGTGTGMITIIDSHFVYNNETDIGVMFGRDVHIVTTAASLIARQSHILWEETIFSAMSSPYGVGSSTDPTSLPAIVELYKSSATVRNCSIIRNSISFIKAFESNVTFSGELTFCHNRALVGTALIFARGSTLIIPENCKVYFIANQASNYGGVFYIHTEESFMGSKLLNTFNQANVITPSVNVVSLTKCFIRVEGSRFDTKLVFINNTAGTGGDVLYGGLVALGWDGGWNCLLSFKNISDMAQQSGLSPITSDPSRVCFCEDMEPNCLTVANPKVHYVYPGQTITIPAVVAGQDFGTVTGSVYAKFINTSFDVELAPGQNVTSVDQSQCSNIEYTIFSENEGSEAVLVLTAGDTDVSYTLDESVNLEIENSWNILNSNSNYVFVAHDILKKFTKDGHFTKAYYDSLEPGSSNRTIKNFYKFLFRYVTEISEHPQEINVSYGFVFPKEIYGYPIYSTVSFYPCPIGFTLTSEKPFRCDCNDHLQHLPKVKCHIQDQTITRSGLIWVGSDGNETVITSQQCPLDYCKQEDINVTLNDSDSQCNYNHSGTLCGGCQAGLSLVLGSNQCQRCSNTHIALLLPFAISGVVLVAFIKLTDLTVSQGTLNGLIFYANVIKANEHLLLPDKHTPLTVFISWLNLDLGVETCFFDGLSAYSKVWLQFVFPIYIWSIAGLIIVLSSYSDRVAKLMGNNSVPVLATLFLLSYAKLLRTIILALSLSILTTTDGSKAVWSTDGNIDYLGAKHAPLFVVSVGALLFLWLPYTVVLFFGQWLYRCNLKVVNSMLIKIKPFLDAHYGPMKPNHRYWYGALLLVRAVILLFSALVPIHHASTVVFCITVCSFLLAYFAPILYDKVVIAMFDSVFFINLGILSAFNIFASLKHYDILIPSNVLVGLAFTQFIGLVLFKVAVAFNIWERMRQCIHRPGPVEDNGDDDWDLYEEAALLREREAEMEREAQGGMVDSKESENETDNSIASRPTYGI